MMMMMMMMQAIAKGAESLFVTVTQKASLLSEMCGSDERESYSDLVQQLVVAAMRLSEEVREREGGGEGEREGERGRGVRREVSR